LQRCNSIIVYVALYWLYNGILQKVLQKMELGDAQEAVHLAAL